MKMMQTLAILVISAMAAAASPRELPLMPMPAGIQLHDRTLPIDGGFTVAICGTRDALLERAVSRFLRRLSTETGIFLQSESMVPDCAHATLTIKVGRAISAPALGDDESYALEVTPQGAQLSAPTTTGVLRGLATFEQLAQPGATGFEAAAVTIDDRPRFPWRGLMLDVSRHWMPLEVVERNLDAMAQVKLNVFHWHLSDDQGFRVESRVFPKLQEQGSDGHYYTQEQVRHVVNYARDRGIRVIPEFDTPGHTTSWLVGYPELGSAPGPYKIDRDWGVRQPVLDPTKEATYRFLDRLFGEMASLFPDPYFHIGGDEVLDRDWKANARIQSFLRAHNLATSEELHGYFNGRLQAIVAHHGKILIGWDEILTPALDKRAVIQSWRGQQSLAVAARQGHRGLLSYGFYLDHMKPASYHYATDPMTGETAALNPVEAERILGGEACMWTEYVSPETVDSRLWPRLAAIAERLWSPAAVNDVESMYSRLETVSRKLEWTGLQHRSAQARVLARIAGNRSEPALQTLVDAVEALGIHDRYPYRKYASPVPLNRFTDAAVADSEAVRHLTMDASALIANPADKAARARLNDAFHRWRDLPAHLAAFQPDNYLIAETLPVAEAISRFGVAGEQALQYLDSGQPAPPEWTAAQDAAWETAGKPFQELTLAAARVIRVLLDAVRKPATRLVRPTSAASVQ